MSRIKKKIGREWKVKYLENHTGSEKTIIVRASEKTSAKKHARETVSSVIQIISCQLAKNHWGKKKSKRRRERGIRDPHLFGNSRRKEA